MHLLPCKRIKKKEVSPKHNGFMNYSHVRCPALDRDLGILIFLFWLKFFGDKEADRCTFTKYLSEVFNERFRNFSDS